LSDGRKKSGSILRVLSQSVVFSPNSKSLACEDLALSEIAGINWPTYPHKNRAAEFAGTAFVGAVLTPFFLAHGVASTFRQIAPPLHPITGEWESNQPSRSGFKSEFVFTRSTVRHSEIEVRRGRYHVEGERLQLALDGAPEEVTSFHFNCGDLVLDNHADKFYAPSALPPSVPIVGAWRTKDFSLDLNPDGTFVEQTTKTREGSFEQTGRSIRIHWHGGEEWTAEIKRHHMALNAGGAITTYRYIPPAFAIDL